MTSGIIEKLREDVGVQALCGLNEDGSKYKVFPVQAPQGEKAPYITVFKGSNDPIASLTKDLASELDYVRVTVNCWHKNFRACELMFEAVRNALDNLAFTTDAGYDFSRVWLVDDRDGLEEASGVYVHICTFGVEQRRIPGAIYAALLSSNFMKWGGMWNWADNSNNVPQSNVTAGTMWITEDVLSDPLIPAGTWMTALTDGANDFSEFNFNL